MPTLRECQSEQGCDIFPINTHTRNGITINNPFKNRRTTNPGEHEHNSQYDRETTMIDAESVTILDILFDAFQQPVLDLPNFHTHLPHRVTVTNRHLIIVRRIDINLIKTESQFHPGGGKYNFPMAPVFVIIRHHIFFQICRQIPVSLDDLYDSAASGTQQLCSNTRNGTSRLQ